MVVFNIWIFFLGIICRKGALFFSGSMGEGIHFYVGLLHGGICFDGRCFGKIHAVEGGTTHAPPHLGKPCSYLTPGLIAFPLNVVPVMNKTQISQWD